MLPDWVSNPGPLTYESGALPIALSGPAFTLSVGSSNTSNRVATVREKYVENDFFSRSGKSQGVSLMAREI